MPVVTHLQPREKLQQKGPQALTQTELLQVLIGSGNAQINVARIAKKAVKQLTKHGTGISYGQLLEVTGLGPARVCQIIAAFELATRYPLSFQQAAVDSPDKVISFMSEVRTLPSMRLVYVTLDGAKRLIMKRTIRIRETTHPSEVLRRLFADATVDNASGLILGIGSANRSIEPSMFDLSFAKDCKVMAQLFSMTIHELIIVNKGGERSLRRMSW